MLKLYLSHQRIESNQCGGKKKNSLTCLPSGQAVPSGVFKFVIKSPHGHSDLKMSPTQSKHSSNWKQMWAPSDSQERPFFFLFSLGTYKYSGSIRINIIHPSFKSCDPHSEQIWNKNQLIALAWGPKQPLESLDIFYSTFQISELHQKPFHSYSRTKKKANQNLSTWHL